MVFNNMLKIAVLSILAVSVFARVPEAVAKTLSEDAAQVLNVPVPTPRTATKCGQAPFYERERIINGSTIPIRGSFPFMVNLKNGWQHHCGGVVYDKYTVITAAHCFDQMWEDKCQLFFADFDQKVGPGKGEIGQEKRKIKNLTMHPDRKGYQNDIAIVKLDQPIPFNNMIQPICMPSVEVTGGEDTIVMGWGYNGGTVDEDDKNKLQYAHVPIIPRDICRRRDWYSGSVTQNMICAGFEEGMIDSCTGDSGGPLVMLNEVGDFELIGIVSFGTGCAKPRKPGVHTDVYDYIDWIKEVAGEPQY